MRGFILAMVFFLLTSLIALSDGGNPSLIYPNQEIGTPPDNRTMASDLGEDPFEPCNILEDQIFYDGMPTYYYPQHTEIGRKWAVRFTPDQPCSLSYLQIVTYPTSGMGRIHVWSDDGNGFPDTNLIVPFDCNLLGNLNYQRIDLDPPINIGNVDFHAGWEHLQAPPPYTTSDGLPPFEQRSKTYDPNAQVWNIMGHNLNIRAGVIYYGEDHTPPEISHIPIDMGFTEGDPTIVSAEVTDESGVAGVITFYNYGIGYTPLPMNNVGGNTYQAEMPPFPAGTTVQYYIEAVDASPNRNTAWFPAGGYNDPIIYPVVEGAGIAYDDGERDGWWIVQNQWDSNAFAVRFTPESYPVKVTMARAYVNGTDSFYFTVNEFDGQYPGDIIGGPWTAAATEAPQWVNFEIPGYENIIIEEGDFCVLFNWFPHSPDVPGVGSDNSNPDNRSYWRYGQWNRDNSNDFMIRAVVQYPEPLDLECSTYCYTPVVPANHGLIQWSLTITNVGDTLVQPVYGKLTPMINGCQGTPYQPWVRTRWITTYIMPGYSYTGYYNMPVNNVTGVSLAGCNFDVGQEPGFWLGSCCFEFHFTYRWFNPGGNPQWPDHEWYEIDEITNLPSETDLLSAYPNPFNAQTEISYNIATPGRVRIDVYNLTGQKVETLIDDYRDAGRYDVIWDASNYSSGIYFYRLTAGEHRFTKRMTLIK